jgi:excinuclease UvrABC nuclease subunit
MATKRFSPKRGFTKANIERTPAGKPVVYEILDGNATIIYAGKAKRREGPGRIADHLPDGQDPIKGGKFFRIKQMGSIHEAQEEEKRIIKREKPKYNKLEKPQ